ncbi:MAG: hypothetical protein ABI852_13235 [Gemmatimonadaceae bacterium]
MKTKLVQLGLVITAALTLGRTTTAQSVNISGGRLVADHYLLGSSMRGVGGAMTFRTPVPRLDVQLSLSRYAGTSSRVGVVCAGLVEPGTCGSEAIHDESTLYLFSVGPSINIVRAQGFTFDVIGQVQGGGVNSDTYGLKTGRSLTANKTLWGVSGGVAAGWQPNLRKPIVFQGSVTAGRLGGIRDNTLVDGYSPYEGKAFSTHQLSIGVAYLLFR